MQADIVLEKELKVLHLDLKATKRDCVTRWALLEHISDLKTCPQEGHTF